MDNGKDCKVINLSKSQLKNLDRNWRSNFQWECNDVESLILDENELTSLENVGCIPSLLLLSAAKNRIRRMSCLPTLENLRSLDLSNNSIVCIESLRNTPNLTHLNLSGNYIKLIDHLVHTPNLEYLDLSDNAIGHVTDLSALLHLKELFLHKNHLSHLRNSGKYLPGCLEVLTLSHNNINDLAEVSHLEPLQNLRDLSIKGNPCLEKQNSNYRPYLKMWCLGLTTVDGVEIDPIESLKAEWLYSQGRGRRFRPGEQASLLSFLATVSPLPTEEKKLRLILSKAELHQQQLRQQDRMVSSYHEQARRDSLTASPELMARSFDVSVLRKTTSPRTSPSHNREKQCGSPLQAASTLVPVPESLISPDVTRPLHPLLTQTATRNIRSPLATSPHSTPVTRRRVVQSPSPSRRVTSPSPRSTPVKKVAKRKKEGTGESDVADNEDTEMSSHTANAQLRQTRDIALRNFKSKGRARSPVHAPSADMVKAALCIQRRWRGYRTRNLDTQVLNVYRTMQANRMQDYIIKVAEDMKATKSALEGNRKMQAIQMQFISAMWQKMSSAEVENLAASCLHLTKQVEELRGLVSSLQAGAPAGHPAGIPSCPIATQTEIIAVHTPQGDAAFPYPGHKRPVQLVLDETVQDLQHQTKEDVCWTPACQEGRDLQSLQASTTIPQ